MIVLGIVIAILLGNSLRKLFMKLQKTMENTASGDLGTEMEERGGRRISSACEKL